MTVINPDLCGPWFPPSPIRQRIRTFQSAYRDVKYPDENGKKPLKFNARTAQEDHQAKHYRKNSEGNWVPRDPGKVNFD